MLKALKQLYKDAPCKVVSSRDIPKLWVDWYGYDGVALYNPLMIIINKKLPQYKQVWVLAHETGHIIHKISRCNCTRGLKHKNRRKQIQREYHALQYELKWLIKHKQTKALKHSLRVWKTTTSKIHSAAYKRFCNTKYGKAIILSWG